LAVHLPITVGVITGWYCQLKITRMWALAKWRRSEAARAAVRATVQRRLGHRHRHRCTPSLIGNANVTERKNIAIYLCPVTSVPIVGNFLYYYLQEFNVQSVRNN